MVSEEELAPLIGEWTKINKKTRETFCKNARKVTFSLGDVLLKKENVAFFIVKKGTVNVFCGSENGEEVFLYRLLKGDGCSVMEELTYEFPSPTDLIIIDKQTHEAVVLSATVAAYFLRVERKQQVNILSQMSTVLFSGVEKRLADFLLSSSARNKGKPVVCTHEQIAKFIGTSREVVTRKLKTFEEENLVSLARGRITVMNRDELKKKK